MSVVTGGKHTGQREHDGTLLAKRTVSALLKLIEAGLVYFNTQVNTVLSGASQEFLIQVGANRVAIDGSVTASGDADTFLFEGPTFSAAGSAETLFNVDRSETRVSNVTITSGPTLSADGTQLSESFINGGEKNKAFGGSSQSAIPLILKASTDYLIRITNNSGSTASIGSDLTIVELDV